MKILVSACLLGVPCRYDGLSKTQDEILTLGQTHTLVPVCPEQLGGLATPRPPAERIGQKVFTRNNQEVTDAFSRGANETLRIAKICQCDCAILKEKSPSCGCGTIYDGTFSNTLAKGNGVTAQLLLDHNIPVYGESNLIKLIETPTKKSS